MLLYFVHISDKIVDMKEAINMKTSTSTERLRELFDSDSRNDSAIARELGVSRQTVSSWRTGVRSPKKPMLVKIADTYHVSIEWLMGFDVGREEVKNRLERIPDMAIIRKMLMHMDPDDYEVMVEILNRTEKKMRGTSE